MSSLPVTFARDLDGADAPAPRFLIDGLWSEQAVGIVGGEPKCCKSFLALQMAVAVATGTPCLDRYSVHGGGRVLLYPAEDAAPIVRRRLESLCRHAGTTLAALDLAVISVPALRLDLPGDRDRLLRTVEQHRPALLILDPFVRVHRIDENASGDVGPLLAYLRELQRTFRVAVVVVHHARKNGTTLRPGQALRGSSEFHAWGDSNLYVRRVGEGLCLQVEHRAAPSIPRIDLRLVTSTDQPLRLEVCSTPTPMAGHKPSDTAERVLTALATAGTPVSRSRLRDLCQMKTVTLSQTLAELLATGRIARDDIGQYRVLGH